MKLAAIISTVIAFVYQYSGTPMTQAQAQARFEAAGVYASSPGGCTTRSNPECTSYEGILSGTVDGIIDLKEACECAITITGGTELIRHAGGTYKYR
ncbi:unnamed protein product [Rhizoctonia solani]|uniref:Uncharacterized protein n=1 Tax=Rhizoctonia solani TaxID=456999 RepID=A0A8H3E0P0_9AGAM|nr:unnamed protein product [Rhizoctonia solani]